MPFPIPPNEPERLRALRRLNIPGAPLPIGLDRVCSVAQTLFGVPVVLMVFLDEEVAWIKSGAAPGLSQQPRALSFCNHTVMHDEVFVVPDARADPRFADHPYVTGEPRLHFYAGAPFTTAPGIRIGSLCLVDHVPRDFTPGQMRLLGGLARVAVDQLWLHHLEQVGLAAAGQDAPAPPEWPLHARPDFGVEPRPTGAQVRAGRGLVNWSVRELAAAADVAPMTVKRLEASDDAPAVRDRSAKAVREALEAAGVEFVFQPGYKPGVRPR